MNAHASTGQPRPPARPRGCAWSGWDQKPLLSTLLLLTLAVPRLLAAPNLAAAGTSASVGPNQVLLTNALQVLRLTPAQAKEPHPVRLRGMVTSYDPGRVLFVQDETAGIFVYHVGESLPLAPGQAVEVNGVAAQGRYSPIVSSPTFAALASGPHLQPLPVTLAQVYLGGLDAQWVELSAVVRTERIQDNRLRLELADTPYRLSVWFPHYEGFDPAQLAGALVRVRGVVGIGINARGEPDGFQLFANSLADLTVLQGPPPDPFATAPWPIGELRTHAARLAPGACVHVRGLATLVAAHSVFVQDATGGVEVETDTPLADVQPGRTLDVAGFLSPVMAAPRLEDAVVLKLKTNAPPSAAQPSSEELFAGAHAAQLVTLEAQFLGLAESSSNRLTLALQCDSHLLNAQLDLPHTEGSLPGLEPGARLRLTGVCRTEAQPTPEPRLTLLLRSPADLAVIAPPNSPHRLGLQALAGAAILISAALAVALWFLQKQRRRTEDLLQFQVTLQTEMRHGEQQLRRSIEEREHLARDLHDDIIQSIYAVGLNLETCRQRMRGAPEQIEPRLTAAIQALNKTIRSVRSFITGLEPKVLNGREFKTALKSLALTSGEGPTPVHIEVDTVAANSLDSTQATQLLHIAKEAMSNSLRHAQAADITISLLPEPGAVRLEIRDDGQGFAPDAPDLTGHGLRNMRARAREIGASLKILSAPGQGCSIIALVPTAAIHEPH